MSNGTIQVEPDGAGKHVDNELIAGAGPSGADLFRQRVRLGGDDLVELVVVRNDAPGGSDYALVVRNIPSGTQPVSLASIPLAAGAATDAGLSAIVSALSATLAVTGTVAVASSALPTGAATQTTLAAVLAAIVAGITVSGSVAVSSLPTLPAGNNNIGDVDVASLPALPAGGNAIGTVGVTSLPVLPAGNNNIGDVDVASLPALPAGNNNIGDVDVASLPALPAGGNAIGTVGVTSLPALPAGNNNVGDVDVVSLPALPAGNNNIGDVDVATQPARSKATDSIVAVDDLDSVNIGGTSYTVKRADISLTGTGDIVAAVASKKIRMLEIVLNVNVDGTIRFRSNTTNRGQEWTLRQAAGFVATSKRGWMETASGEALNLLVTTITKVAGFVTYVEI